MAAVALPIAPPICSPKPAVPSVSPNFVANALANAPAASPSPARSAPSKADVSPSASIVAVSPSRPAIASAFQLSTTAAPNFSIACVTLLNAAAPVRMASVRIPCTRDSTSNTPVTAALKRSTASPVFACCMRAWTSSTTPITRATLRCTKSPAPVPWPNWSCAHCRACTTVRSTHARTPLSSRNAPASDSAVFACMRNPIAAIASPSSAVCRISTRPAASASASPVTLSLPSAYSPDQPPSSNAPCSSSASCSTRARTAPNPLSICACSCSMPPRPLCAMPVASLCNAGSICINSA